MNDRDTLVTSFVEVEQVASGLQRIDNQIIYGRRGTGKTHALRSLAHTVERDKDLAIYLDLRKLGSNNGLYSDGELPLPRRATQLLIDVVESVHTELLTVCIDGDGFEAMFPKLDAVAEAATEVRVEGPVKVVKEETKERADSSGYRWKVGVSGSRARPSASASGGREGSDSEKATAAVERMGQEAPRLLFGRLAKALGDACAAIAPRRTWVLLDEWSSIPIELQPYLADMLRRTFFTCRDITVKIAAVERRSRFVVRPNGSSYLGIELGADTAAALNLDEHLLASENMDRAQAFFAKLLRRHLESLMASRGVQENFTDTPHFLRTVFLAGAFAELVKAAEGIPRDAINIVGLAAGAAQARPIGTREVQMAARKYFLQDKESGISGNPQAQHLWDRLQREVVAGRGSRTFLVKRNLDGTNPALLDLYDERLIHLLQSGLSTPSRAGVSYDGYAIDYGSYIHSLRDEAKSSLWDARSRPWAYQGDEASLPDRFDESVIFTIGKGVPKTKKNGSRKH